MRRAALALCIIFFLFVLIAPTSKAIFATLTVTGVAVGALSLGVTVVLLCMTASNLRDAVNNAAEAQGMDTKSFIRTKLVDFANFTGTSIRNVIDGLGYTSDGKITISKVLGQWVADFMNWLINSGDITPPATPEYGYIDVTGGQIFVLKPGLYPNTTVEEGSTRVIGGFTLESVDNDPNQEIYAWAVPYSSTDLRAYGYRFVSDKPFTGGAQAMRYDWTNNQWSILAGSGFSGTTLANEGYYKAESHVTGRYIDTNTFLPWYGGFPSAQDWDSWNDSYTGVEEGYDVGIWENDEADAGYVLDPTSVLGLDGAGAIDQALDGSAVDINDYLDAVSDVLVGDDPLSLELVGGEVLPLPNVATAPSIPVTVPDTALDDSYPATGENTPNDVPYTGTGEYSLNLTNFFPFCIPFDIYRMLKLFDAQAEAPEITIPIVVDSLGISEEVSIDLGAFDSVAQILRTVELIAFCVGLAFVTKKLIQGG